MGGSNYKCIYIFVILNLLGLVFFLPKSNTVLFVKEFYFTLLLLVVAGVGLFALVKNIRLALLLFAVFFAANLFNEFYIYYSTSSSLALFLLLIIIGAIGFTLCIIRLGGSRRRCLLAPHRKRVSQARPIIVDNIPSKKSYIKIKKSNTLKKRPAKKAAKKKAVKKKAPKKKVSRKKVSKKKASKK